MWSPSGLGNQETPLDVHDLFQLAVKTLGHPQQAGGGSDQGDFGHKSCPRTRPGTIAPSEEQPSPSPGAVTSCERLCGGEAVKHTESFFYGKLPSQVGHKLCILLAAFTWGWPPWGQQNRISLFERAHVM